MRSIAALSLVFFLASANNLNASILIGSAKGNDNVTNVNEVINTFNGTSGVTYVSDRVDKLEDSGNSIIMEDGNLSLSDIEIFAWDESGGAPTGPTHLNVFDRNSAGGDALGFSSTAVDYGSNSFDSMDQRVFALDLGDRSQLGADVSYFVVKSGQSFSVWASVDGLNIAYADAMTGSSGNNYGNAFNPAGGNPSIFENNGKGVSHISFYASESSSSGSGDIPEPASVAIWSVIGIGGLFAARRRKLKASA